MMVNVRSKLTAEQEKELRKLQGRAKLLTPQMVVNYARNEKTALHDRFTWDDSEAAEQWRLHQARNVIRVVVFEPTEKAEPVRCYVSLQADRDKGRGYRKMVDVLSDTELRTKLLAEAHHDFERWQHKYRVLEELAPVFEAMRRVKKVGT